jgi:threonine dehydratase
MRALFPETPLQKNEYLSNIYGANIYLKREDLSPVRSYKIRGAFNAMSKAIKAGETPKFVCASAGNHAQGFAYACQHFSVKGPNIYASHYTTTKNNKNCKFWW